jgi:hypothetical protein
MRTLSSDIQDSIALNGASHYTAAEIELPFKDGDSAPIVIRAASASGIELTSLYDFQTFTYKAFLGALGRVPTASESTSWYSALQTGFDTSPPALYTTATDLINALFASAEYTARMRSDDQFVSDIYFAFLGRVGDAIGLTFWIGQVTATSRATVQVDFNTSDEFRDRVASLNQPHAYDADLRSIGTISLTEGVAIDGGEVSLQNLGLDYSVPLAETDRRLYPAPATLQRVFKLVDETFESDTLITGYMQFTSADGISVKGQIVSDMSRRGLNVIQEVTQRCDWLNHGGYKGPGCASPDPSPTCSGIFDDAVNGCASKQAAPQIIDPSPPNNQPRFKGVPPLASNTGPTSGLTPENTNPSGWPSGNAYNPHDPSYRPWQYELNRD